MKQKIVVPISFDDLSVLVSEREYKKHHAAFHAWSESYDSGTSSHVTTLWNGVCVVSHRGINNKNSTVDAPVLYVSGFADKILEVSRVVEIRRGTVVKPDVSTAFSKHSTHKNVVARSYLDVVHQVMQ